MGYRPRERSPLDRARLQALNTAVRRRSIPGHMTTVTSGWSWFRPVSWVRCFTCNLKEGPFPRDKGLTNKIAREVEKEECPGMAPDAGFATKWELR